MRLIILLLSVFCINAQAQKKSIEGIIVDNETMLPLEGVEDKFFF